VFDWGSSDDIDDDGTSSVVLMGIRSLAYTQRVRVGRLGNYSE